ncbi:MAG: site-specific DNA-methyltransferase [Methylomonas sp.]|nr:site-specific DNA-methyltransferase [Methylomonas sp.]
MADNYDDYSRDELIRELRLRDRRPRFGLVWERKEIEHEKAVNEDFVALDFDPALSCGEAPYRNLIIEGDNFDALRYLRMTHAGKIKCIYIDPPYNTGNRDFIYNDRFVDKEDNYRHSKWLEFMYRRFMLARDLLAEDGVLLVSINDVNRAKLELLLDQVFPGMNLGSIVWRNRQGSNADQACFLSVDHEHVVVYGGPGFQFQGLEKSYEMYGNPDNDPRGSWRPSDLTLGFSYKERPNLYYPLIDPETDIHYPPNPDRIWVYASRERLKPGARVQAKPMEEFIELGQILFPVEQRIETWSTLEELLEAIDRGDVPKSGKTPLLRRELPDLEFWVGKKIGFGRPAFKRYKADLRNQTQPLSSWITPKFESKGMEQGSGLVSGTNQEGAKLLSEIFDDKRFNYPKPLSLIHGLILQATQNNDIILDFFAGSGTTAHAVLDANQLDGGNRKFIMVSCTEAMPDNPDKNLCRDVCAERIRRVAGGFKNRKGTGGNFAYLRTHRLPTETLFSSIQHDAIWTALQLIHAESLSPFDADAPVQQAELASSRVCYLPKINDQALQSLTELMTADATLIVYVWQPGLLRQHFEDERWSFLPIPRFLVGRFGSGR